MTANWAGNGCLWRGNATLYPMMKYLLSSGSIVTIAGGGTKWDEVGRGGTDFELEERDKLKTK